MREEIKYTVATLFFDMENVHLIKDPGMIPFTLQNSYGWKAVVPLWDDRNYEYKGTYFKDIETPRLRGFKSKSMRRLVMTRWLVQNARRIDVLHLFFYDRWTWIYIWIYKLINAKGKVYVHCDTDGIRLLEYTYPSSRIKQFVIRKILLKENNVKDVLWGIQNKENCRKLEGKWPFKNIEYIPNGIKWDNDDKILFHDRKNIILTVARNGTAQKRTDLLLEGFAAIAKDFPDWTLHLVGTIERTFELYIRDYFNKYPELRNRVQFHGPIKNRNELQTIYRESKMFCLTSAWESFGLVTVEALSCGCYVIESDIPANVDITQNGTYGTLFESGSLEDFSEKLRQSLNDEDYMESVAVAAEKYAKENFTWEKVLLPVVDWVGSKRENK